MFLYISYNNQRLNSDMSRGSAVSIVSGHGLDDRAIEVRSTAEAKEFFLWPVCPDRLWGPPSLLYKGYRGPFLGAKARPGRDVDHSPHLVPRSRMSRSYTSSPPSTCVSCNGTALALAEFGFMFLKKVYDKGIIR
jgi:hypothetical protein